MSDSSDKTKLLEAEIQRLEHEHELLDRQWNKKHFLALFGLLAIPAYFLFGGLVAGVIAVCTPFLVLTQAYLLTVRRAECRQLIREAHSEIAFLRHDAPDPRTRRSGGVPAPS